NLTIDAAAVDGEAGSASVALNAAEQTATLTLAEPLSVGPHTLRLSFKGQINKFGRGLFHIDYPTGQGRRRMLATQLEPAEARRIFPCWDEPAFKASFEFAVTIADRLRAVSNMPTAGEAPAGAGLKRVA